MQDPFLIKNKAAELTLFKSVGLLFEITAKKYFQIQITCLRARGKEKRTAAQNGNPLPRPLTADVLICPLYPCEYPGP